jgi:hypothetical protein
LHNYNYNCIQITPQQIPKPTKWNGQHSRTVDKK